MPPRRRPRVTPDEEVDWDELRLIVEQDTHRLNIASQHLTKCYFDMVKELNKELECPICLDKLHACCSTLLCCGHYLHAGCLLRLQQQKCPVCRAE